MNQFKWSLTDLGPFRAYHCIGKRPELMTVDTARPFTRSEYPNVFLVIDGWINCKGPGLSSRFRNGQVSIELPDYPRAGRYTFYPGSRGVEFFCISVREKGTPFNHSPVSFKRGSKFTIDIGTLLAINRGEILVDGQTKKAPFLLYVETKKTEVKVLKKMKGVVLWKR